MKTLQHRNLAITDLEPVCLIEQEYFSSDRISRRQFRRFINNQAIWGAFLGQQLIAYCIVLTRKNSFTLRLYSIVVVIDFQGQGIWQSLLDYAIARLLTLKDYSHITLEVATTNTKAIRAYQKYGFIQIGYKPNYYQDGTDAVLMAKKLQQK